MDKGLDILLVEDNQVDQMAFERFVAQESLPYRYVVARSVSEAHNALAEGQFDVALMDYLLGDGTAFDLFGKIGDVPIVMLTGSGDEEIAVEAMKAGAADYLIKDPAGNYLKTIPVTVENAIRRRWAEEELRRYREQLEELVEARTAELTQANERLSAEIVERKRAEEALRKSQVELERSNRALAERVIESEALHSVGVAMSSELETEALLQFIVERAAKLVEADSCSVLLPDEGTGELVFRAAVDQAVGMRVPAGQGIVGRAFREQVPQIVHDVTVDPDHDATIGQQTGMPTQSMLVVPLLIRDRAIGLLTAVNKREGRFTDRNRDLLVTMASHAAIAIENARLYEQARQEIADRKRAERLLQGLNTAALAMQRALATEEIFAAAAAELKKLGFSCTIFSTDADQRRLFPDYISYGSKAVRAAEKLMGIKARDLSISIGAVDVLGETVWERQTVFVRDVVEATRQLLPGAVKKLAGQILNVLNISRSIDVPLIVEDEVIGMLSVQSDDLVEGDVPAITAFANQMAAAWRKAQLFEQAQREIAERRRAEAEVSRLAAAVEQATETIMITDLDGDIVYANPYFEVSTGYTVAEAVGQNPRMLKSGHQDDVFYQRMWNALTAGRTWKGVVVNQRKDGSLYHEEATIFPVKDPSGEIINYVAVKWDITERVQAEEALRASEARYRGVVEDQTELICRVLTDGRLIFVNEAYCDFFGKSREELLGQSHLSLIVEEDRAEVERQLASLSRETPVVTFEERVWASNGEVRWQQWTARAIFDGQGQIVEYQGVGRDITDRRLAAEALERYADRLRTLYAISGAILAARSAEEVARSALRHIRRLVPSVGAGIVDFDLDAWEGTLFAAQVGDGVGLESGARFPLAGREPAEALRRGKILVEEDVQALVATESTAQDGADAERSLLTPSVIQTLQTAGVRSFIAVPLIAQGELIGALAMGSGSPSGFSREHIDIAREVADQVAVALRQAQLYEQVQRYVGELERRVDERTADLSAANAELARASRLKDEFLASMSHELRTPLNAILGLSEALQEQVYGPLTEKQLKSLASIEQSGRLLLALINDVLDVSKIGAGKLELEIGLVSVESVCRSSLGLVKQSAHTKRLKVSSSFDSAVKTIQADPRRLKQILANLLSNAVKFTPEGGTIGLEVVGDADNEVVRFTVWDTGIGISSQEMERLFQPFVQLDSSLAREHTGTGLGLVLVQRMAEMHGGGVSVESEPGQGSRFTVSLPWIPARGQAEDPTRAIRLIDEPRREGVGRPETLALRQALIVEDSHAAADQIARYLDDLGIDAVVHPQGEGVVERVLEVVPDVVILDILLPDLTGWGVLTQLKGEARTRDIPVLIVSVVDDRARGLAMGASDYLVKPISRGRLQEALAQILPWREETRTALVVASEVAEVQEPEPVRAGRRLILLAEDNEGNINTLSDYLLARRYRVVVARNGAEALERVAEQRPDLILMDIQMPGMDGLEATQRIRANSELADIPIIALTALAMPGDRERCLKAGANEYLSKPVSLRGLVQVIETQLGQ